MTSLNKPKLIVIGATGFVGRRFCQYLLDQKYHDKCNLVFSARNLKKLAQIFPKKENDKRFTVKELDTLNVNQVESVLEDANLVANFAGPFDLYAEEVIRFCSAHGINYFDITGEFHFVKRMIKKYQTQAKESGAVLLPFSGFDSIPSEVSTFQSIELYKKKYDAVPRKIEHLFFAKGGFNGGTIASAFNFSNKISIKDYLNDHFLLHDSLKIKSTPKTRHFSHLGLWGSPFFMDAVNSKVIFFALKNLGKKELLENLEYSEHINLNKSSGRVVHKVGTAFLNSTNLLMGKKIGQHILKPFLPSPGQGPSEKSINSGFFKLLTITSGDEGHVISKMKGLGDPGNKVTVNCMLSVLDSFFYEKVNSKGFLTPYSCFGESLIKHLENHEVFFEGEQ